MSGIGGKCIVLGVTGGIAAYKACELVSRFVKLGIEVHCILTKNATEFVSPLTFESLSNHPAVVSMWARAQTWEIEHISLAQRADLFLIAPCTANVIGKLANGIADDMLTTTAMATRAPLLICPAMNTGMWENMAVRRNCEVLRGRGAHFVDPAVGRLACGDVGAGKLADVEEIVRMAVGLLTPRDDLRGKRVVVTAGPTREMLDPVRYLTNFSSGKMGYAIARAARERGAEVTLVSGAAALDVPPGVECVRVQSTRDLLDALLERAPGCDALIQAAAPADYRPVRVAEQKIKKRAGEALVLELEETPDVAATVGRGKRENQVFVAFAAETQSLEANARDKLVRKNADFIVANDVTAPGAGFEVDTNIVTIYDTAGGVEPLGLMTKREVADRILDRVADKLNQRQGQG